MRSAVILGVVLCLAGPASAQSAADQKKAQELYKAGITHYNLGEYDQAIAKFKEAYGISNVPGLLFNIAQAYRLKKEYDQALSFYRTFIRLKPDAPFRKDVEARIKEMEGLLAEQERVQKEKPTGTIGPGESNTSEPANTPGTTHPTEGGTTGTPTSPGTTETPTPPTATTPETPEEAPKSGATLRIIGVVSGGVGLALRWVGRLGVHAGAQGDHADQSQDDALRHARIVPYATVSR